MGPVIPSRRRGGRDIKKNAAKHPLKGADGVVVSSHRLSRTLFDNRWLKQPPRLRQLRNGAIFFMAQPPLLREGGDTASPKRNLDSSGHRSPLQQALIPTFSLTGFVEDNRSCVTQVGNDPDYDILRDDPRFKKTLGKAQMRGKR